MATAPRTLASALAAALLIGSELALGEVMCVGGNAHEVVESEVEGEWAVVRPIPRKDRYCQTPKSLSSSSGSGTGGDERFCLGFNTDTSCQAAKEQHLKLPLDADCESCYLGASIDFLYSLNISNLQVESLGLGFRGTTIRSSVLIADQGKWSRDIVHGSTTFPGPVYGFRLALGRLLDLDVSLSMPTELTWDVAASEAPRGTIRADILVDLGDNYFHYEKGVGWKHETNVTKYRVNLTGDMESNIDTNLTLGVTTGLQAKLGSVAWAKIELANTLPVGFNWASATATHPSTKCMMASYDLSVRREAEVHAAFMQHNLTKHWGPHVDRHWEKHLMHRCRPPQAEAKELLIV